MHTSLCILHRVHCYKIHCLSVTSTQREAGNKRQRKGRRQRASKTDDKCKKILCRIFLKPVATFYALFSHFVCRFSGLFQLLLFLWLFRFVFFLYFVFVILGLCCRYANCKVFYTRGPRTAGDNLDLLCQLHCDSRESHKDNAMILYIV